MAKQRMWLRHLRQPPYADVLVLKRAMLRPHKHVVATWHNHLRLAMNERVTARQTNQSPAGGYRVLLLCLALVGTLLLIAGFRSAMSMRLDGVAPASVERIERDPNGDLRSNSYLVHYTFTTAHEHKQAGRYMLDNALTTGDVPRRGSFLQVSYSTHDPSVNRPWNGDVLDLRQLFLAEFLLLVGAVLLLAGLRLR